MSTQAAPATTEAVTLPTPDHLAAPFPPIPDQAIMILTLVMQRLRSSAGGEPGALLASTAAPPQVAEPSLRGLR